MDAPRADPCGSSVVRSRRGLERLGRLARRWKPRCVVSLRGRKRWLRCLFTWSGFGITVVYAPLALVESLKRDDRLGTPREAAKAPRGVWKGISPKGKNPVQGWDVFGAACGPEVHVRGRVLRERAVRGVSGRRFARNVDAIGGESGDSFPAARRRPAPLPGPDGVLRVRDFELRGRRRVPRRRPGRRLPLRRWRLDPVHDAALGRASSARDVRRMAGRRRMRRGEPPGASDADVACPSLDPEARREERRPTALSLSRPCSNAPT